MRIFTIGHSNHSQDEFLNLLKDNRIETLVDVRSDPYSRWAPYANRDSLKEILESVQIHYIYLGDVLGGHPTDPDIYEPKTGKVDYHATQEKEYFKRGIKRILGYLERYRLCIMCAEEDPASCHRNLLVAESLRKEGISVFHIRGDGRVQTDEEVWKQKIGVAANQYQLPL